MNIIKETIHSTGAPATFAGFDQLAHCVFVASKDKNSLNHLQKSVYAVVAAQFNTDRQNVERNLRTVIKYIWENCDHERLNEIAGYKVRMKPPAGEMISILVRYTTLKRKNLL